jgi:hypothetical protein
MFKPHLVVLSFSSYMDTYLTYGQPVPEDVHFFIFSCLPEHITRSYGNGTCSDTVPVEVARVQNRLIHFVHARVFVRGKTPKIKRNGVLNPEKFHTVLTPAARPIDLPHSEERVERLLIDENLLALWDRFLWELHDVYWTRDLSQTPDVLRNTIDKYVASRPQSSGTTIENLNNAGYNVLYGNHTYPTSLHKMPTQLEFNFPGTVLV